MINVCVTPEIHITPPNFAPAASEIPRMKSKSQVSQKEPDRLRGLNFSPASWALLLHSESCAKANAAEEVATGSALHLGKYLIGSNTQITTRGFHSIPHLLPLWQALKRVQANWALKRFYGPWIAVATFQWYCK